MRLNLGACDRAVPGFLSVDIAPPADMIADLSQRWPWADSSIDEVVAYDIVEHLPDKRHTMNELWRVLRNGGKATVEVPTVSGVGSCCDPTHVSLWSAGDFEYYEKGNYARERFRPSYGIVADFKILDMKLSAYSNRFGEKVTKATAILEAVK